MMTNDDTRLLDGREFANQQSDSRKADNEQVAVKSENKGSWKKITFGTASGILVGAGAMYAVHALASDNDEATNGAEANTQHEDIKVAKVSDDLSFQDAFDAARAQVGSGGVFRWNGGLYSTYNEDEWNNMSDTDKAEFAQAIRPEVRADEIVAERMSETQPQVVVVKVQDDSTHEVAQDASEDVTPVNNIADNSMAYNTNAQQSQQTSNDDDVHVVGQGTVDGHQAVALDLTGNGEADVAVIDINDNRQLDGQDVAVFRDGTAATMDQIAQAQTGQGIDDGNNYASDSQEAADPYIDPMMQQTAYDHPDLSPDMPDYMDDVDVNGTLV